MKKYANCTYQNLLDSFFKDNVLKSILSAQAGCLGLPPKELSAVSMIFLLKTFIIDGTFYPKGGSQVLSDKIAKKFKNFGGIIHLNSEATEILFNGNKVCGIRINNEKILCNFIISSSDIMRTYKKLVNPSAINKNSRFYPILNKFKVGSSCCILYLGLSNKINLRDKNGWYYPSYDINGDFAKLINVHIPSIYDKTVTKNNENLLVATFPYAYERDKKYDRKKFKEELIKKIIPRLETHIPDISKAIIVKEVATPITIERHTLNSGGSLYGWEQSPSQTHMNCFPTDSPIKGLFHAGHWTLPGGGIVAVAASGINVAKKVLKKCYLEKVNN